MSRIGFRKLKYEWPTAHKEQVMVSEHTEEVRAVVRFLTQNKVRDAVLLAGIQKSGNTWLRFIICHYFRLLSDPSNKSVVTYDELNTIQPHVIEKGYTGPFATWMPALYRTHRFFSSYSHHFNKVLYIYRHPLDALISLYHAMLNSPLGEESSNPFSVDDFVMENLPLYIKLHIHGLRHSSVTVSYEDMRVDTESEMRRVFGQLGWVCDAKALRQSIKLSSFEQIRKMEADSGQHYGNHGKAFRGPFTRNGASGQFQQVLKRSTLQHCSNLISQAGLSYSSPLP